jgi:hypothetical protein
MLPKFILACIAGAAVTEFMIHNFGRPYVSKITKLYHVTIGAVPVWPPSSYYNTYSEAKSEYDKCIKENPNSNYKLVSYPAVVTGFLLPTVIGITGESKIIEENKN